MPGCTNGTEKVVAPPSATRISIVLGNDQTAAAGTPLHDSLVVRVDDERGSPLPGVMVSWQVTAGGGAVSSSTSVTDTRGLARTSLTLGRATGADSVTAEVPGSTIPQVHFGATAIAGPVSIVTIVPSTFSLLIGENRALRADLADAFGNPVPGAAVLWASDAPAIATVSPSGVVTALSQGNANIAASTQGKGASASATVSPPPVSRVDIANTDTTLSIGQTVQFTAIASDVAGKPVPGAVIQWVSTAPAVASVSAAGLVTAQTPGSASITATSQGRSDTVLVNVTPGPVAQVKIQISKTTLFVADTVQLSAVPRDSANNLVPGRVPSWSSSAPAVVGVGATGLVTAHSPGTAIITATIDGVSDTVTITSTTESIGVYSETAPGFRPDIDTFFGTFFGLGAVLSGFRDDSTTKVEGTVSLRTTIQSNGGGFAGWFVSWGDATHVSDNSFTRDMSKYAGGSIRFWVLTPVDLEVGIRSGNVAAGFETSEALLSQLGVAPGASWKQVCMPVARLAGPSPLADLSRMKILFVASVSQNSGGTGGIPITFWIDDVRWDTGVC